MTPPHDHGAGAVLAFFMPGHGGSVGPSNEKKEDEEDEDEGRLHVTA